MTDKATPSPASYDSVMVLYREVVEALLYNSDAVTDAETEFLAEVQRLAAQAVDRETGSIVDALKQDVELDKQQTGRLVLEASTGIHGEVSEILAKEWAKLAERLAAQAAPTDNSNGETKLWLWKNFINGRPEYWAFDNPYPINLTNGDPQTLGEPCGYAIFKPSRQGRTDVTEDEVLLRIAQAKSKVSYNLEPNNAEADAFDFLRFAKKNLDMHVAKVPFAYNGLVTAAVAWIQSAEKILAAKPSQAPVVQAVQATSEPFWFEVKDKGVWLHFNGGMLDLCAIADQRGPIVREHMKAALQKIADRTSSGATTQAVRMLTKAQITDISAACNCAHDRDGIGDDFATLFAKEVLRVAAEESGLQFEGADGVIGGAA